MRRFNKVEFWAMLAVAACVAWFLVSHYNISATSDPGLWYLVGLHFPETFAESSRAYFFPMLVWIASKIVGAPAAFLVNIPVVLALVMFSGMLARRAAPKAGNTPAFSGLTAVALLLWVDHERLLSLCSAYRDAASYALLLLALILLADFRRDPTRRFWRVAVSAAAFAFAISSRETSAIVLPAVGLYAITAKLRDRNMPFVKPLLVMAGVGFVCLIPLLVQNLLVAGNAFVPAQATMNPAFKGSLVPGISVASVANTLPEVLAHLRQHIGLPVLFAALAGLVALARQPHASERFCLLALPALIHTLFYGAYLRVVSRYLFSVDLFVIPLAAVGVGALFNCVIQLRPLAVRRAMLEKGVVALLVLAIFAQVLAIPVQHPRFTLEKLKTFQQHLETTLPTNSMLLGERPLGDYLRAFAPRDAEVVDFITSKPSLLDPAWGDTLRGLVAKHDHTYFAGHPGVEFTHVLTEFDLRSFATVPATKFGMRHSVGGDFGLYELVPWSATNCETTVAAPEAGDLFLTVGLGRLSRETRTRCELAVNGVVVDAAPADGYSVHLVRAAAKGEALRISLTSDKPVPANIIATLQPASQPLVLTLKGDDRIRHSSRFSDEFTAAPHMYLEVGAHAGRGWVDVPTPGRDASYEVTVDASLKSYVKNERSMNLSIRAGDTVATNFLITHVISPMRVRIDRAALAGANTRLHFETTPIPGKIPGVLALRRITVERVP